MIGSHSLTFDISNLSNGVYIVKASIGKETIVKKLIKKLTVKRDGKNSMRKKNFHYHPTMMMIGMIGKTMKNTHYLLN